MNDPSLERLRRQLERRYGDALQPYGWSPEEIHGFGFVLRGIPATFSILTREGSMPLDRYDIQIESLPPGDYLYSAEASLDDVLRLIPRFTRNVSDWPENPTGGGTG